MPLASFEITRGGTVDLQELGQTERGFCNQCGTPLTFHYVDSPRIAVSIGSLDQPAKIVPATQYGIEGRLPYFAALAALPGDKTTEQETPDLAAAIARTNHQHPDHDTEAWPPAA